MFKFLISIILVNIFFYDAMASRSSIRERLGIKEGVYKKAKGASPDCLEGEFKIVKGSGTYSLFAGGGLMAAYIDKSVEANQNDGCSKNYTNTALENGFENTESVFCPKLNLSYTRKLIMKFSGKGLVYNLETNRVTEKKKTSLECQMKLSKAIK